MARGARKRSTTASLTVAHNAPDATDSREGFGSDVRSLSKRRKDVSEVSTVAAAESVDAGSGLSQNRGAKPGIDLHCYEELEGPSNNMRVRIQKLGRAKAKTSESPSPVDSTDMSAFGDFETSSFLAVPISMRPHDKRSQARTSGRRAHDTLDEQMASVMAASAAGNKVKDVPAEPPRTLELATWPRDWSLKTSVRVTAHASFDGLPSNPSARAKHVKSLIPAAVAGAESPSDACHRALIQYRHPASPLPESFSEVFARLNGAIPTGPAGSRGQADAEWVADRMHVWSDALISAYSALKSGQSDYFYYIGSPFTVLFQAAAGDNPPFALLSQSTANLRKTLAEGGIAFSMPLVAAGQDTVREDEAEQLEELRELGRSGAMKVTDILGTSFMDGGVDTMLLFKGVNLKGLFDFLLNRKHDKDVPLLVSSAPFLHATATPLKFTNRTTTAVSAMAGRTHSRASANAEPTRYVLEVEGIILPSAMRTLADALSQTHERFKVEARTDGKTLGFNAGPPVQGQLGDPGERIVAVRGYWDRDQSRFTITTSHLA